MRNPINVFLSFFYWFCEHCDLTFECLCTNSLIVFNHVNGHIFFNIKNFRKRKL